MSGLDPVDLARVALEARAHEELDERALEVLAPVLGEGPARQVLAGAADVSAAGDEARLVRDAAALLHTARQRIEAEQHLRETNAKLAASERLATLLLESAGEGLYAIDLEGRCTAANREAVRLLGYDHEGELLGRNMHELVHHTRPDGTPYPEEECRIFKAYREGRGVVTDDEVLFRKDGSSFPVEYRSFPIQLEDGQVDGSVLTFFDITDRKASEQKLRRFYAERRATALALHDDVVQALATANYALALGEAETTTRALEEALLSSQALVAQLLADTQIDQHVLVRDEPPTRDQRPAPDEPATSHEERPA
jgi:PAS domain S-box-containing protein